MPYQYKERDDFEKALHDAAEDEPDIDYPEQLYWNRNHPIKSDNDYQTTVVWHGVDFESYNYVNVLNRMFCQEFDLQHDIRTASFSYDINNRPKI